MGRPNKTITTANLFIILGIMWFACCPPAPKTRLPCAVAVREHQLRFDAPLPISPNQKVSLIQFLVAGGDRHVMGEDAVIPGAAEKYGPLLDFLVQPENVKSEKLSTGMYSKWFTEKPTYEVIDSRDEDIPAPGSVMAYCDGAFWWIFRQKDGVLVQLMVMKANPADK